MVEITDSIINVKERNMDFTSFEQALSICMTADDNSEEQIAAMLYCLKNAPPELMEMLQEQFGEGDENHHCGCGCEADDQHECTN
jgi:hypothetical protein